MVNKVFTDQIGHNIEVFVDDIIVKSKRVGDHIKDLEEVSKVLRMY